MSGISLYTGRYLAGSPTCGHAAHPATLVTHQEWESGVKNSDRSKRHEMMTQFTWTRSYEAAILETDRSRLAARIQAAEAAIKVRAQELNGDHYEGTEEERIAINDALSG